MRRRLRILAFDTATWICAVALVENGVVCAEARERTTSSHAETLPRLVASVLPASGMRLYSDAAIAVSIGPGSFTGLRIGLSFAKGLALAGSRPVVGVPTLDALALAAMPWEGRLCVALDARKREVYAAVYEHAGERIVRVAPPRAVAAPRLADELGGPCTVIGDAVEAYGEVFVRALGAAVTLVPLSQRPPRARAVAQLAAARLAQEPAGDDLATLAPAYVRPPEAELTQPRPSPATRPVPAPFVDKVPLVY